MSLALAVGVHATCNPYCGDKTQGWDKKCDWGGCYSCTECSAPAPVCKPFCEDKTQGWDDKCTWVGCTGCTECIVPEPECKPFCEDKTQGWDDKCTWGGCSGCTECLTSPPSAPPPTPPPPTPPPPSPPVVCKPFCEDKTQDWDDKCTWRGCNGCTECAPVCKPFCEDKTQGWTDKCTWRGCDGCSECSSPAPVCKSFCEDKTQAWDAKCTWGGCNGCSECGPSAPPPTLPPPTPPPPSKPPSAPPPALPSPPSTPAVDCCTTWTSECYTTPGPHNGYHACRDCGDDPPCVYICNVLGDSSDECANCCTHLPNHEIDWHCRDTGQFSASEPLSGWVADQSCKRGGWHCLMKPRYFNETIEVAKAKCKEHCAEYGLAGCCELNTYRPYEEALHGTSGARVPALCDFVWDGVAEGVVDPSLIDRSWMFPNGLHVHDTIHTMMMASADTSPASCPQTLQAPP